MDSVVGVGCWVAVGVGGLARYGSPAEGGELSKSSVLAARKCPSRTRGWIKPVWLGRRMWHRRSVASRAVEQVMRRERTSWRVLAPVQRAIQYYTA